jgi:hypothetical protein
MSNLLREYIELIVERGQLSGFSKKELISRLLQTADENSDEFATWRISSPKYGEIRLAPTSPVPPDINYSRFFKKAGFNAVEASTSVSGKYKTWDVTTPTGEIVKVVFAVKTVASGEMQESDLTAIKILGFAGEHAVYAAMNKISNQDMIKNLEKDDRINTAIKTSLPEDVSTFFENCKTMRNTIKDKLVELGINARADKVPSTGSDEYDLTSTKGEEKYFIHVKYQSDRLVGIPKPASQSKKEAQKNPSVIYKNARDSLLFKNGVQGGKDTLHPLKDELLASKYLTSYGKKVLKKQKELGESEIAAIIKVPSLRKDFDAKLEELHFSENLIKAVKQQLGLESKGEVSAATLFFNFSSNEEVKTQVFLPGQGKNIELSLVPGNLTSQAFTINATVKPPNRKRGEAVEVVDAFRVELGSIRRAKYVQLHKGAGFSQLSKSLEDLNAA